MPPRLTVVIPTRERRDTLAWALKSCVTQTSDELSILVSDNASEDGTRDLVHSHDDPRVSYINPGRRLGMSEHWEFALSHVRDGYVIFLGDDDGMMPEAAAEIVEIGASEDVEALVWPQSIYYWPEFFDPALANTLSMRLPQSGTLAMVDSAALLRQVARFEAPHHALPSPYWGAVHRTALDRVAAQSGRVFHSIIPDIFAGVAVAAVTSRFLRTDRLHTLSGSSRHSQGASQLTGKDGDDATSPSRVFESENEMRFHHEVSYAANVRVLVAECLVQARENVAADVPEPDLEAMFAAALKEPDHVLNPAVHTDVIAALKTTAARHHLTSQLDRRLRTEQRWTWLRRAQVASRLITVGNPLHDCTPDGVQHIYDATLVADRLRSDHDTVVARSLWTLGGRLRKSARALDVARARLGTKAI